MLFEPYTSSNHLADSAADFADRILCRPNLQFCQTQNRCSNGYSDTRGATRLDGAWDKKQVWRPHVRTWALSEANCKLTAVKKVLVVFLGLFGTPAVNGGPGNCASLSPSLRPWVTWTLQNLVLQCVTRMMLLYPVLHWSFAVSCRYWAGFLDIEQGFFTSGASTPRGFWGRSHMWRSKVKEYVWTKALANGRGCWTA